MYASVGVWVYLSQTLGSSREHSSCDNISRSHIKEVALHGASTMRSAKDHMDDVIRRLNEQCSLDVTDRASACLRVIGCPSMILDIDSGRK